MSITYAFLTGNPRKSAEYKVQLAKYAREIRVLPYSTDEAQCLLEVQTYLKAAEAKDRYVLRETSDLFVAAEWEQELETVSAKNTQGERVYHVSTLVVYTLDNAGALQQKSYRATIEGHVDLSLRQPGQDISSWWDDIFVAVRSHKSYVDECDLYGKASARQQAIGQFICDHVLFKRLKDVTYNPHQPTEAVDFNPALSAVSVLRNNAFVCMAQLDRSPWGLGNLLTNLINEGTFFRSADSRRSGNYFCPPISGILRHQKPDPFWETTFQLHDFFHQAVPDQIFTGKYSPEHRRVYVAARLMSEGLTLVLADMLFVEAVKESGFEYDFGARKINPLFSSLNIPGGDKRAQLKSLLNANVGFANLGSEDLFRPMLKAGAEPAFAAYTGTYKHFFVPDLLWSAENYDDMVARKDIFAAWMELVGSDLFAQAELPLLDDLVTTLQASGADLSSYASCVQPIFEHIFENVLAPKLAAVAPFSDELAQSNAFRRYMIGQSFLYATYRDVPGVTDRGGRLIRELQQLEPFSQQDIARIRGIYKGDLAFLKEAGIITQDDLLMYGQMCPLFSPRFLSYDFDQTAYDSVQEAIKAAFNRGQ